MAYTDPRLRGQKAPSVSADEMERRNVARLDAMKGSELAFLDQRIPGYQREIINIIGMGVVENLKDPDLQPKIAGPAHGFAVTYVRHTPKGHGAALHRHPTEEVFIAAKGPWEVFWLEGDAERKVTLQPGDIVNVPIGIYRGFRKRERRPRRDLDRGGRRPRPGQGRLAPERYRGGAPDRPLGRRRRPPDRRRRGGVAPQAPHPVPLPAERGE